MFLGPHQDKHTRVSWAGWHCVINFLSVCLPQPLSLPTPTCVRSVSIYAVPSCKQPAGAPADSGICLQAVRELGPDFPLFGVCMGHQCIGEAFGGVDYVILFCQYYTQCVCEHGFIENSVASLIMTAALPFVQQGNKPMAAQPACGLHRASPGSNPDWDPAVTK